jgi:hypothetical protein
MNSTTLAIKGPRNIDVGIETIDPITKPLNQALKKMGVNPTITTVMVKDIISDNENPIKTPVKIGLYFAENLTMKYTIWNLF